MEHSGSYGPTTYPGKALLAKAKRLAKLPEFGLPGEAEAFFAWDRDLIELYDAEARVVRTLPLQETLAQYEEKIK